MGIPDSVLVEWYLKSDPAHPHQTRGWSLMIVSVVLYSIMLVIVLARLCARIFVRRSQFGLDDFLVMVALIPVTGLAVLAALGSQLWGYDRHIYDFTTQMGINYRKSLFAMEFCYVYGTTLTKISILLFYRRVVNTPVSTVALYIVWVAIAFLVACELAWTLGVVLLCSPTRAFWFEVSGPWASTHEFRCGNEGAAGMATSVINMVQDFIVCLLPTFILWNMRLPRRQKIAIWALFAVGYSVCIISIVRIWFQHKTAYGTYDSVWWGYWAWLWSVVEADVGLICASAPALKIYFDGWFAFSPSSSACLPHNQQRWWGSDGKRLSDVEVRERGSADGQIEKIKSPTTFDYNDLEIGNIGVLESTTSPSRSNSDYQIETEIEDRRDRVS